MKKKAAAKKKPKTITLGYSGNGTVAHLSSELAQKTAGIELQHIPYKGAAQAMTDVMSGQVDLYMSSVPTLLGHVRDQKLRALAVTSIKRSGELPDTPTLAESGYKDFDAVTWFGILAPAGTPADVVARIAEEIRRCGASDELKTIWAGNGAEFSTMTPPQFGSFVGNEVKRWATVVKASGAKFD
mgnify:CR=1 FL=1